LLSRHYPGRAEIARKDALYDAGVLGSRELMKWDMDVLPHDAALLRREAAEMAQDRTFPDFVRAVRRRGATVEVVSDGLGFYVRSNLAALGLGDLFVATNDNTVAYWVPDQLPATGQPLDLVYRLHWQGAQQMQRPPGAWVTQTRVGRGYGELAQDEQQFVVDFTGPSLAALPPDAPVKAVVTAPSNGQIVESNVYRVEATGQWRMTVRVKQLSPTQPTELRGFLQSGTNVLTETWSNILPAR